MINSSKASLTQNNLARKSISLSHVSILVLVWWWWRCGGGGGVVVMVVVKVQW